MLPDARFVRLADGRRLRVFDARRGPSTGRSDIPGRGASVGPGASVGRGASADARGADPVIVLEGGLGASGRTWGAVFHRLAPFARVIAYDRAGYGASDPPPAGPRTLARLRDDLLAVIDDGVPPDAPLVLVGHSWGGPIIRAAAAARLAADERVDGLVLVDPSDERCELYFGRTARAIDELQARLLVRLARLGLLRPLVADTLGTLPRALREGAAADSSTVAAAEATSAETRAFTDELAALRTAPPQIGRVPVRIVSGVRADYGVRAMREALRDAHRASAHAAADGRFINAPRSAHGVPFTEPQLVADTALALARAAGRCADGPRPS